MRNSKLVLHGISKKYGEVSAVDDLSVTVYDGEIICFLGPSGCGKTTTLRAVAGLEDIQSGSITIDDQVVSSPKDGINIPPERRNVGLVFQSFALWPHLTVYENITYGLKAKKIPREEHPKRVERVLDIVKLQGLELRYPAQLSGGQQQRVALARALVYEPRLLLLDEPLSNLDARERENLRTELRTMLKGLGITVVYVTHDQEEAFSISDRIIVMNAGKVVQEGTARQVYEHPANEFVVDFLGRANVLPGILRREGGRSVIALTDVGSQIFANDASAPEGECDVVVRRNELEVYGSRPKEEENVLTGAVLGITYRGFVTDYLVKLGKASLTVTANKILDGAKPVYVHFPPEKVSILPKKGGLASPGERA